MKKIIINNAIKIDGLTFENEEMKTAIMINIVIYSRNDTSNIIIYLYFS